VTRAVMVEVSNQLDPAFHELPTEGAVHIAIQS